MLLLSRYIYIYVYPKNTDKNPNRKKDPTSSHMLYLRSDNIFKSATENDWLY